jgi:organic radical activating enzyme
MNRDAILERTLNVVEIFHSIQGEGANSGKSAVFVRLSSCNKNCNFCDTDWSVGVDMTVKQIFEIVDSYLHDSVYQHNLLIWTGGEPTLQLDDDILSCFSGYYNCIETNGSMPVPSKIDYISCSPKVSSAILKRNFTKVNELRFPIAVGDELPLISDLPAADHYFVSPIFVGNPKEMFSIDNDNVEYCIQLVKNNPQWSLSVQMHKLLNIR